MACFQVPKYANEIGGPIFTPDICYPIDSVSDTRIPHSYRKNQTKVKKPPARITATGMKVWASKNTESDSEIPTAQAKRTPGASIATPRRLRFLLLRSCVCYLVD